MQLGAEREIPGDQRKAATGRQKVDFKKNNNDGVDVDVDDGDDPSIPFILLYIN